MPVEAAGGRETACGGGDGRGNGRIGGRRPPEQRGKRQQYESG
jgi:hypothetical protein